MAGEKQQQSSDDPSISPLAGEKTYGEKQYDFIFGNLINFWLNLTVSAAFTYWVTHSQRPFKLIGKEFSAPSLLQQKMASGINKFPILRPFGVKEHYDPHNPPTTDRAKLANTLANVFTLVMAGHPIMIGSVWLGAKIKAPFVKYFNRMHYGDDAMESDDLKARHLAIEEEERPTLWGACVGRLGTIFATQFTGYSIANSTNAVTWLGKKVGVAFPGLDKIAEVMGGHMGKAVEDLAPNHTAKLDAHFARDNNFNWSARQIQEDPGIRGTPYRHVSQHMGKYLAQDVLYSAVTAVSINPAMNFLKQFIPGMTYRPNASKHKQEKAERLERELNVAPNKFAVGASADRPQTRVSSVAAYESPSPQQGVQAAL